MTRRLCTIPLAPRTARAIDLAVGERTEGPLLTATDGRRLDRHGDPAARFRDLGADWHERRSDRDRKIRSHLRQLQALGLDVIITPAAV